MPPFAACMLGLGGVMRAEPEKGFAPADLLELDRVMLAVAI